VHCANRPTYHSEKAALGVEARPVEVRQHRRQPREAVEEFARAGIVAIGRHRKEPFNDGQHTIDIRGKPLRRRAGSPCGQSSAA
jgi:hypothetical protein